MLPKPDSSLATVVPASTITAANEAVKKVIAVDAGEEEKGTARSSHGQRGEYEHFTPKEKARIGKRASEHGVTATVRFFSKSFPGRPLKESSVRTWKKKYEVELAKNKKAGKEMVVPELVDKKRGRPLLLGSELDKQVQAYLTTLRTNGAVVNTAIAMACAEGVVKSHDSNQLECNGGPISLTKHWAKYLLHRMGFVKRRASTKAKLSASNFEELKTQFLFDIKVIIEMEQIPGDLVINWDQTGIHYVPVSSWTMAKEGSQRVEIAGIDDKRQITAVFGGTSTGEFLPIQLIYKGKTRKSLPSNNFPSDWHVTFTDNHWANEKTMTDYLEKILFPYIEGKRKELQLDDSHPALVIFDRFRAQCTNTILELLASKYVHVAIVPANCTDRLQPLDVSVNKAAKEYLRRQFQEWYSEQVCLQLQKDGDATVEPVDLRMGIVKPLGAKWMMGLYDYMKTKPDIIRNGFRHSGLLI